MQTTFAVSLHFCCPVAQGIFCLPFRQLGDEQLGDEQLNKKIVKINGITHSLDPHAQADTVGEIII